MTEDKQSKVDRIIEKKPTILMTIVKAIVIGLFVVLAIGSIFAGILQFTTFDAMQNHQSPNSFIESKKQNLKYGENGFVIGVPEEVIGYELNRLIKEELSDGPLQLESLSYSGISKRLNLDMTYYGFYLPLSYEVDWESQEDTIRGTLSGLEVSKLGWQLPDFLNKALEKLIELDTKKEQSLFVRNYGIPSEVDLSAMESVDDLLVLSFKVDEEAVLKEIDKIRKAINPDLLDYYKTYDPSRTEFVVNLIEQIYPIKHAQIEGLINDVRGNKHITNDLILLTEGYDTSELTELLGTYNLSVNETTINLERKAFKGQAIDPVIAQVFLALDDYFVERILAFNQGKPYDFEAMNTLTIKELVKLYEIEIDEETLELLNFVYEDGFKIAYKIDDETYYVRSIEGYEVVSNDDYMTLLGAKAFIKPDYVSEPQLWEEVTTFIKAYFEVEEVYVRYMKSDGQSTFAVVSTDLNPQDYWSMALYKDEVITVLDENVIGVANLITEHPDFNVETATREIENIQFESIPDSTHNTIIDELYDIGIVSSKRDTEIIYSSYDGSRYISFMLNNGKEYVFKVEGTSYGTYLATVYTKERALSNWKDMSELLLLQEKPE